MFEKHNLSEAPMLCGTDMLSDEKATFCFQFFQMLASKFGNRRAAACVVFKEIGIGVEDTSMFGWKMDKMHFLACPAVPQHQIRIVPPKKDIFAKDEVEGNATYRNMVRHLIIENSIKKTFYF